MSESIEETERAKDFEFTVRRLYDRIEDVRGAAAALRAERDSLLIRVSELEKERDRDVRKLNAGIDGQQDMVFSLSDRLAVALTEREEAEKRYEQLQTAWEVASLEMGAEVAFLLTEREELREALRPFARGACKRPDPGSLRRCGRCSACRARSVLSSRETTDSPACPTCGGRWVGDPQGTGKPCLDPFHSATTEGTSE